MAAMKYMCRAKYLFTLTRNASPFKTGIQRRLASDQRQNLTSKLESSVTQEKSRADVGWLSRLLVRSIDTGHESQSSLLSSRDTVYELQFDAVKPEHMDQYLKDFQTYAEKISSSKTGARLVGSWTVEVGDLDEAVHLWEFEDGYPELSEHKSRLRSDKDFIDLIGQRKELLRSHKNQILLAFSFWPGLKGRDGSNIYELRSYVLKPGTMIEWGNYWAKGIKFRTEQNEAVAGFFSQIGDQNNVHHFFAYKSLQDRKELRENNWSRPGWDSCVAHTVPLIRHMTSRILIPTRFSPLQ